MADEFLTSEQTENYGRYAAEPNEVQLARYFHLDERALAFINQRRGKHNYLGITLQLTTASFLRTFLGDPLQIPSGVRFYVAGQLYQSSRNPVTLCPEGKYPLRTSGTHQTALWLS